jgi:hypothetical protein
LPSADKKVTFSNERDQNLFAKTGALLQSVMAAPGREELEEERAIFDLKEAPTANCYDSLFEMDECVVELLEGELTTD